MKKDIRTLLVERVVDSSVNWVIGGYENSVADGHIDEMPSQEQMEAEIYDEVMATDYVEVAGGLKQIKKDIRFLGTETIKQMITDQVTRDLQEVEERG